jgi:hypothetical protein
VCISALTSVAVVEAVVDTAGRLLVLFPIGIAFGNVSAGSYAARWFDAAGNALTDWFSAPRVTGGISLNPVIGGGIFLNEGEGQDHEFLIVSGKARTGRRPSPSGKVCGQLTALGNGVTTELIGRDGTLIGLGAANSCTASYVPALFK